MFSFSIATSNIRNNFCWNEIEYGIYRSYKESAEKLKAISNEEIFWTNSN